MTSAELAKELRIKESYLRKHWCSIVESYAEKGLTLVRIGRGVSAKYFSNQRIKKLKELSSYCDFEDRGRKGFYVKKVYIAEYGGKARKIVERDFKEAWKDNPNTIKNASDYICEKNRKFLTVTDNTVYQYTCTVKRDWYGVAGKKGRCKWVYCVIDKENKTCRYLTEEEEKIKKEMLKIFFKDEEERAEEVKKLQKSRQLGEISDKEYIEESEKILGIAEGGEWDRFNQQFMKTIGCYCDFALELEESGF